MIRRLFVSDAHYPHVDNRAIGAMLEFAKDFKPTEIVILGDYFDMYCVSRYKKNPDKLANALEEELHSGVDALRIMRELLKPQKMYFLVGNHEYRLQAYLEESAPIVRRLIPPLHELFELPRNCELVAYGEFLRLGDLSVHHGIAVGKTCTARMLDMLGTNILTGHTHRLCYSSKRLYDGKVIHSYSAGWLGDFKEADYTAHADWSHGFATGLFCKSGKWSVQLHAIQNGVLIANDKEYVAQRKVGSR